MKVLIIMHSSNTTYGAAKSLQKLIENCDWDFDVVYPKSHFHPVSESVIREYTNYKCNKIECLYLPFRSNAVYNSRKSFKEIIWETLKRVFEFRDSFRLKEIIRIGEYDYVFLNSLTLYPLISNNNKYILYIREKFLGDKNLYKKVLKSVKQANKVIFIDKAITEPFNAEQLDYLILNNPFDMNKVNDLSTDEIFREYDIPQDGKIVISLIGLIAPDKGTDFVINAFNKAQREDLILLIVGKGNNDYVKLCKNKVQQNICFIGESKEIEKIYKISDYVVRADSFFATGRTVYEGLYSGCDVIIQGTELTDSINMFEYNHFKDRIHFYSVRNEGSLIQVLNTISNIKRDKKGESNLTEYIENLKAYIEG